MLENTKLRNYLHLHFIIFIWSFTAILGKLISIEALSLVWHRMVLATIIIGLFILISRIKFRITKISLLRLFFAGVALSLHWVMFFTAIKVSNVSVALITMSTGAFYGSLIEPIWYKRKIIWYEVLFGLSIILGLYIIFNVETTYFEGIMFGLISSFFAVVFTMINGKLIQEERPSVIGFYEIAIGAIMLSAYLYFNGDFSTEFFTLSSRD